MGMSMLATMISSVTFVAYPGSSYAGNWSLLVPDSWSLATLPLVAKVVIPFYREEVGVSAYEYFEKRFGRPARLYASAAFSLAHFSKMGFVLYLMALTISSMTGWNITVVIVSVAVIMVTYTVIGGIEAVVWTDVVQGFVMWIGIAVALGFLLFLPAGGPEAVFSVAARSGKFSLGDLRWDWSRPTIPVAIFYGLFWYGQRYVADQTMVQRYLLAKSDSAASARHPFGCFAVCPCLGAVHAYRNLRVVILQNYWRGDPDQHHQIGPDVPLFSERTSASGCTWPASGGADGSRDDYARQ